MNLQANILELMSQETKLNMFIGIMTKKIFLTKVTELGHLTLHLYCMLTYDHWQNGSLLELNGDGPDLSLTLRV